MNINNSAYFNYLIIYLFILRKNKKRGYLDVVKWPSFNNVIMIIVLLNTNTQKY